jgi:hypothetical protein
MDEMTELSKHHDFLISYVELINRHQRLAYVDMSEISESTKAPLKTLSAKKGNKASIYGAIFESLLKQIEENNKVSRADVPTQYAIGKRISYTHMLLRLLVKAHGMAEQEQTERRTSA